jgi:hypothetical protein
LVPTALLKLNTEETFKLVEVASTTVTSLRLVRVVTFKFVLVTLVMVALVPVAFRKVMPKEPRSTFLIAPT